MAKTILYVIGAVLVVVGLVGFVNDPVVGIFEVDVVHNLVHVLTGLVLLWGAYSSAHTRMVAIALGVVYALVAVLGFVLPGDSILGIIESNFADDVLHVVLAAVLLYAGFTTPKDAGAGAPPAPAATPPSSTPTV